MASNHFVNGSIWQESTSVIFHVHVPIDKNKEKSPQHHFVNGSVCQVLYYSYHCILQVLVMH